MTIKHLDAAIQEKAESALHDMIGDARKAMEGVAKAHNMPDQVLGLLPAELLGASLYGAGKDCKLCRPQLLRSRARSEAIDAIAKQLMAETLDRAEGKRQKAPGKQAGKSQTS